MERSWCLICAGLVVVVLFSVWYIRVYLPKVQDEHFAREALRSMHTDYELVDEDFVRRHADRIYLMVCPPPQRPNVDLGTNVIIPDGKLSGREGFVFAEGPASARYQADHYFSDPLHGREDPWPSNMFSRMYNWEPGYRPTGWKFYLRPGLHRAFSPRNRWIRDNRNFYFINNGPNFP